MPPRRHEPGVAIPVDHANTLTAGHGVSVGLRVQTGKIQFHPADIYAYAYTDIRISVYLDSLFLLLVQVVAQ